MVSALPFNQYSSWLWSASCVALELRALGTTELLAKYLVELRRTLEKALIIKVTLLLSNALSFCRTANHITSSYVVVSCPEANNLYRLTKFNQHS